MSNKRTGRMPDAHVRAVEERSQGFCEAGCGRLASEIHHRRFLSRQGRHNIANLLHLCGRGNHTGCHGIAHKGGAPEGWAISRHDIRTEAEIPYADEDGRLWLLDDAGGRKKWKEYA